MRFASFVTSQRKVVICRRDATNNGRLHWRCPPPQHEAPRPSWRTPACPTVTVNVMQSLRRHASLCRAAAMICAALTTMIRFS
jgi:hypothetical protein